jgi:hypothetical protein
MNARTEGWSRLDAMIAEDSEEGVLARVMTRIAIGDDPREIALSMGMPWLVLRKWLEDKPERMEEWALADRCFADGLAYEGLKAVKEADPETVQVAKLQFDAYTKTAGKVSREEWGEKVQVEINQTISVLDALEEARGRLGRMDTLPVPVTIQQENVEI